MLNNIVEPQLGEEYFDPVTGTWQTKPYPTTGEVHEGVLITEFISIPWYIYAGVALIGLLVLRGIAKK